MNYRFKPEWFLLPAAAGILGWALSANPSIGIALFALFLMPAIIKVYIPYAHDNPKHLWFKRKLYGWGWTPVTWEGWLATFLYVALLVAFSLTINENSPPREIAFTFILPATLLTATFIGIAYRKGEKPRWQWGDTGDKKKTPEKALLLPLNSKNELLVQDRRGHKKPDWGYFGGSIEEGETPLHAVLREAKEELCLDLQESDLVYLGELSTDFTGTPTKRFFYLYPTEQIEFDVREGKGALWLPFNEARKRMEHKDRFDEIVELIRKGRKK